MVECKAKKAECFVDKEALEKILSAKDPAQMKALGRQVRDFLLQTGSKVLVEASPVDKIWGIGMSASDENAKNPMKW